MSSVSDSLNNVDLLTTMHQENERRRLSLFRQITILQISTGVSSIVFLPFLAWLAGNPQIFWLLPTDGIIFIGGGLALLTSKRWDEISLYALTLSAALSIVGCLLVIGIGTPITAGLLWLPLLAGLLSKHRIRDVIVSALLAIIIITTFVSLPGNSNPLIDTKIFPGFSIYTWLIVVAMISAGLVIFANNLQSAIAETEAKTLELAQSLQTRSRTSEVGSEVSRSLASITAQLSATSRQQADGATEQVSAIVAATSSLEELGETAQHIAVNSNQVAEAAVQSMTLAREVETKSEYLNDLTERGQLSVTNVIKGIEAVRNRIESLAQRLLALTEQSREIGNIIDLMREIADETHLLALNAAIESADSKTGYSEGGRRFGVIASEVKNLADRSLESAQEVQRVVLEVQGAIATAVLAAEEGKKETVRAVNQAYTSGQVIRELGQATTAAVESATHIVRAISQVETLSEEITLATRQQSSASEQVVLTMRTIQEVAQEGASGVGQVFQTVRQIGELSERLRSILENPISPEPQIDTDKRNGSQPKVKITSELSVLPLK